MIVKIKSHKQPSFDKLLGYILNEKDRLFDNKGNSFVISYNLKESDIRQWEKQLKENETHRLRKRKDSVYITHEILSWHNEDAKNLTISKLEEMTREYLRLRNPKGIYVAVPHFDKGHFHVHICASGIEYKTGKSMRLSKANLSKLKKEIQQYQLERFPELSNSVVAHGRKEKAKSSNKEYQVRFRTRRKSEKEKVVAVLKDCYKKAVSKETFFDLLNDCGLKTYERGGKTNGVCSKNYKFRFSRLGFSENRFDELEKIINNEKNLKQTRKRQKSNLLER